VPRAVFDTNVLISGTLFGGLPFALLRLAAQGRIVLILSPSILDEYRRVLREKFRYTDREIFVREERVRRVATIVEPLEHLEVVTADPADDRVLEAAVAGKADVIISGDHAHLLPLRSFRGIPIVTPRQFLNLLGPKPPHG
jgi:putative PIN family toxin of toxin-antitoxin system